MEQEVADETKPSPETGRLVNLLKKAQTWGATNGWPAVENYPQCNEIRSIGQHLHEKGGLRAMQRGFLQVRQVNEVLASLLSKFWNYVGDWQD